MWLALPASFAVLGYFSVDSLWGRPLNEEVVLAAYVCALGLPATATIVTGWLLGKQPPGTPNLTMREKLVGRTLWMAMTLPMQLWALATLVAWWQGGPALPVVALYVAAGAFPLAFVPLLLLVRASLRRQAALVPAT
jgi:hypothetical protein